MWQPLYFLTMLPYEKIYNEKKEKYKKIDDCKNSQAADNTWKGSNSRDPNGRQIEL